MTPLLVLSLSQAGRRLAQRLEQLGARLDAGADADAVWTEYRETATVLVAIVEQLAPERRGAMLTTAEMATRLGVAPKTLLKHKKQGKVQPTVQRGKFIRWRGDETLGRRP